MKMRKVCSVFLALALLLVPTMAGVAETEGKVTLNYYGWTDEQSYMTALIEHVQCEQNPDVEIDSHLRQPR